MPSLNSVFNRETLRRCREPGILFGGGLLAGFLLFLGWLALSSSSDVDSPASEPEAASAAAQNLQTAGNGVLGGITGGVQPGRARAVTPATGGAAGAANPTAAAGNAGTAANADAAGTAGNPPGALSEGEALTSGLFGPEPPSAEVPPEAAPSAEVSEPATDQ